MEASTCCWLFWVSVREEKLETTIWALEIVMGKNGSWRIWGHHRRDSTAIHPLPTVKPDFLGVQGFELRLNKPKRIRLGIEGP